MTTRFTKSSLLLKTEKLYGKGGAGFTLIQLLFVVLILGILIGGAFLLLNNERAKTRDAKRMSDMARLQAAFELLYNTTASYAPAAEGGCNQVGILVRTCNLSAYLPDIANFKDPSKGSYTVTQVPSDESYEIAFTLERSYDGLRTGKHTLSPEGIK